MTQNWEIVLLRSLARRWIFLNDMFFLKSCPVCLSVWPRGSPVALPFPLSFTCVFSKIGRKVHAGRLLYRFWLVLPMCYECFPVARCCSLSPCGPDVALPLLCVVSPG